MTDDTDLGLFIFCLDFSDIEPHEMSVNFGNPLSDAPFANIFSHSVGHLLLIFFYNFLCCAKAFKSHLFIFGFISIILGDRLKKILLQFISKSGLPMFSCRSCTVLGLIFTSLIHFEFIFVYCVKNCNIIFPTTIY